MEQSSSEPDDDNDPSYTPRSRTTRSSKQRRTSKNKNKNKNTNKNKQKTKRNKNTSKSKTKSKSKSSKKSKTSNKSKKNKPQTRLTRKHNSKNNNNNSNSNNNSNNDVERYTDDLHTNGDDIQETESQIHEMKPPIQKLRYGHVVKTTVCGRLTKGVTRSMYLNDPLAVADSWNPSNMSYAQYFSSQHAPAQSNHKRRGQDSSNSEFSPHSKRSNSNSKTKSNNNNKTNSNSNSNLKTSLNLTTKNVNEVFKTGISATDFVPVMNIIDPTQTPMYQVGLKNNILSMRMGISSKRCRFRTLINKKNPQYLVFVTYDKIKTAIGGDLEFNYNLQTPGLTTYPGKHTWTQKDDYKKATKDIGYNARIFESPAQVELQYLARDNDEDIRQWFETLKIIGLRQREYYIARLCFHIAETKKKPQETPLALGIINLANYWHNLDKIMIAQWCLRQSFLTDDGDKWGSDSDRLLYNLSIKDVMAGQHGGIISPDDDISVYDKLKHFGYAKFS